MSLEAILKERIEESEEILASKLELNQKEKEILGKKKPKIIIDDNAGVYAAYDFFNNIYIFSNDAVNNALAIGEEVAHSIRLRLNDVARKYLLDPSNQLKEKMSDYIRRINLEEYFGRLGALVYANHKGQNKYNSLWSRIKNFTIELLAAPFEYMTHFLGYRQAEEDFKETGHAKLKKALYRNDISQITAYPLLLAA